MQVVVRQDGVPTPTIATIPGRAILPRLPARVDPTPQGLDITLRRRSLGASGMPDAFCGRLSLAYVGRAGQVGHIAILVPPPPPFSIVDVETMWHSVRSLGVGVPSSVALQGAITSDVTRRATRAAVELPALPSLVTSTRRLLAAWPARDTTTIEWRPVSSAGGREDELRTDMHSWSAGGAVSPQGGGVPERSARRFPDEERWRVGAVATALHLVSRILAERYEGATEGIIALFRAAASRASPEARVPDPPPSAWPDVFRQVHVAAREVLATPVLVGDSAGEAPLCNLWRLYERWVAAQVHNAVVEELGMPSSLSTDAAHESRWTATWTKADRIVEVTGQAIAHATPDLNGAQWQKRVVSVTAELQPDAVVAVTASDTGRTALLVVDAKYRDPERFKVGQLAAEAAKYLWGLRSVGAPEQPAAPVARVMICAPYPLGSPYDRDLARIDGVTAIPATAGDFRTVIRERLRTLLVEQ